MLARERGRQWLVGAHQFWSSSCVPRRQTDIEPPTGPGGSRALSGVSEVPGLLIGGRIGADAQSWLGVSGRKLPDVPNKDAISAEHL